MDISAKKKVSMLSQLAEANRMLTGIENLVSKKTPFCCMITSAAWGEGKTTLCAGLGMLAARYTGKRVLAVDMNWYSPGLHQCFGLIPEWDLKAYCQDRHLQTFIRPSGTVNLDVLTAPASGLDNDSSSAENAAMAQGILKEAIESYDMILVDTASVFPTNRRMMDPVVLCKACDAVVLVVLSGITPRPQVMKARVMLEGAGSVAGVVVNHWKNK